MWKFVLCMLMIVMSSSCNIDDDVTIPLYDEYYRAAIASSSPSCCEVLDYTPAPGQFIGETKTGGFTGEELTATAANSYALDRLQAKQFVSLGGFGGYMVVWFDHSIDNSEGYDVAVAGNSFDGSSEPAVVWVMQDSNGDGKANDEWYELRGSEYESSTTKHNYSVTYYRPSAPGNPVKWVDSEGVDGEIDYLALYHSQPYYYPTWVTADSYTLTGSCLEARNYDKSGNGSMWIQPAYGWGYADNYSAVDRISEVGDGVVNANLFDIDNAVDKDGKAVELKYIDFVKVQCAVNSKSGWLGELSTEVLGVYDYNLMIE